MSGKRTTLLALLVGSVAFAHAQDPQFTQFYAMPTYVSPAFAGTGLQSRFGLAWRDQWPSIPGAFVSYNAYPGQHTVDMVRKVLEVHTEGAPDLVAKSKQAVAVMEFLTEMSPKGGRKTHFLAQRRIAANHPIEKVGAELRKMMSWLRSYRRGNTC